MGKLLDWTCLNCHFLGAIGDRGKRCCDNPDKVPVEDYYARQMKEWQRLYALGHLRPIKKKGGN